jgi:hypothetical protein
MDTDEIRAIPDPLERIRAANQALDDTRTELFAIRRDAVRELRETMSIRQVATALGLSSTRVTQLEK